MDRSLVDVVAGGDARYRLLETIRQDAWDRLAEAGEAEGIRDRHLGRYLTIAERAEGELEAGNLSVWLPRLEADLDNLRGAMDWAVASGQAEALARFRGLGDAQAVATALNNLGVTAEARRDFARARALYEEALALVREAGDTQSIAIYLSNLGGIALYQGN